jgi:chromatin structure-remodeling complex subunit RSC9
MPPFHTIDRTPEWEEFIGKLRAFHEARGTIKLFDPEPRVAQVPVDLLKLYTHIVANGGYDRVSEEKLEWRKMSEDLGLMTNNAPQSAFQLKSIFYRHLGAYWIRTEYNKTPPPPEILEHTTARGGSLLTRTVENFSSKPPPNQDPQSEASGDDGTPSRERAPAEASNSVRASRGLREAPAPRVIYQPDTGPARQSRHASGQTSNSATPSAQGHGHGVSTHHGGHVQSPVPIPQYNQTRGPSYSFVPIGNNDNFSLSVQNYEPRHHQPQALPLRPVETPSNNPEGFAKLKQLSSRRPIDAQSSLLPLEPGRLPIRQALGPSNNTFEGPNIYVRCYNALRSSILEEQAFALNHLVKISFERGDKYRFEQFHGLAEGLIAKALQVGRLFWDVDFTINYDGDSDHLGRGELDGVNGTSDILERIAQLSSSGAQDYMQPADFADQMVLVTEAVLTIRNMVMLLENAWYVAEIPTTKDLIVIILSLPDLETLVELKHSALDVAEQISPYMDLEAEDPLYKTLLGLLDKPDRGTILTALRAIGRISMNLAGTNKLGGVPGQVLQNIMGWLLLNDDELMDACLDFLYQYTAVVANVDNLLISVKAENLVSHLVRLLSHGAKRVHKEFVFEHERKQRGADEVAAVPRDLLERLLALDEPERSINWLRCFFEEDADSSITQITIWQAYTQAFNAVLQQQGRGMINAADFIRNISQVYINAGAQIVHDPGSNVQKFIIKGIRARSRPVHIDGREYMACLWSQASAQPGKFKKCGQLFLDPEKMFEHVISTHLGEVRGIDKFYKNHEKEYVCRWAACRTYATPTKMQLSDLMSHIKTHVIAAQPKAPSGLASLINGSGIGGGVESALTPGGTTGSNHRRQPSNSGKRSFVTPAKTISLTYEDTPRDERLPNNQHQAVGIPLSAVLVLRNIARNVIKTEAEEELLKQQERAGSKESGGWNERLFRPIMPRLYEILTENRAIASYIASLLQYLGED